MSDTVSVDDYPYGFFSNASRRLYEIITYLNTYEQLPREVITRNSWTLYNPYERDITYDFFKHYSQYEHERDFLIQITNVNPQKIYHPYIVQKENAEKERVARLLRERRGKFAKIKYEHQLVKWANQFSDYKEFNYEVYNPLMKKYFTLSDKVKSIEDSLISKYSINPDETVALYYRGTDKKTETIIASYEEFYTKLLAVAPQGHRILLQTDAAQFSDYIKSKNIPGLFIIEENATSYTDRGLHNERTKQQNYDDILPLLATASILSKCKTYICSSGNVSGFIALMRGHGDGIYQFCEGKWYA